MEAIDKAVLRRIVFAVEYLPQDCPSYWEIISKFAYLGSSPTTNVDTQTIRVLAENMQLLNSKAFATDKALCQELHNMGFGKYQPLGVVLVSPNQFCQACGGKLLLRSDRLSRVTIYTETQGTLLGSHFAKSCQNHRKGCKYVQHYGYHTMGDVSMSYYESDWEKLPYIVSSSQTAFEVALLKKFDYELLIGEISYKQKSEIYNCVNSYDDTKKKKSRSMPIPQESEVIDRLKLDRRRLESAHLKYAVLQVAHHYPALTSTNVGIANDVTQVLKDFTPRYYQQFVRKYAGHTCSYAGCKTVLVLDGNMKNRRIVCNARDAGYVTYPDLPGRIKTGCMQTPQYKSRYCEKHAARVCVETSSSGPHDELDIDDKQKEGLVVEMILGKKMLRSKVMYEVLWLGQSDVKTTWEVAEALPGAAIKEYEEGVSSEAVEDHKMAYGVDTATSQLHLPVLNEVKDCV